MKQHFKDYKAKMQQEEEAIKNQAKVNFLTDADSDTNKGIFVKKKSEAQKSSESTSEAKQDSFKFNFNSPCDEVSHLSSKINAIELK